MTSAALCQTSWHSECRSWSSVTSWAPLPPGCLCLRRTFQKVAPSLVSILPACLASAPALLVEDPGALWATSVAPSWVCCPQMRAWRPTATATAAAPALTATAGPSLPQTCLFCRRLLPVWGRALFRWTLNSVLFEERAMEVPFSAPATLHPRHYSLLSLCLLGPLGHRAARRPPSRVPAPPQATAPATVKVTTAQSHLRVLLFQDPPRSGAVWGTSGPDLILETGSKVRCELVWYFRII